jgi:hypothetical protein
MVENVITTKVRNYVQTDGAMETLEKELARDREIRSRECKYCFAQPGDPCHTRSGYLTPGRRYHIQRLQS